MRFIAGKVGSFTWGVMLPRFDDATAQAGIAQASCTPCKLAVSCAGFRFVFITLPAVVAALPMGIPFPGRP